MMMRFIFFFGLALILLSCAPARAATMVTPGTLQLVPLDVAIVTTGGTAVTAIGPGKRSAGGWLFNPTTATVNLCINEQGTATGTTSSGSTTCIAPGTSYNLTPSPAPVSVVTSDSAHAFSGTGYTQ